MAGDSSSVAGGGSCSVLRDPASYFVRRSS